MRFVQHRALKRTVLVAAIGLVGGLSGIGSIGVGVSGASVRVIASSGKFVIVTGGTISKLNAAKHTFDVAGLNVDNSKMIKYKVTYGTYTKVNNHQKLSNASKLKNEEQNMSVSGQLTGSTLKAEQISLN